SSARAAPAASRNAMAMLLPERHVQNRFMTEKLHNVLYKTRHRGEIIHSEEISLLMTKSLSTKLLLLVLTAALLGGLSGCQDFFTRPDQSGPVYIPPPDPAPPPPPDPPIPHPQ